MSSVAVVTWASMSGAPESFTRSAAAHNVPVTIFGQGRGYPHLAVFTELIEQVQQMPEPYVLLTDAFDVIVARWDADEVTALVDAEPSGLLASANEECWPVGPWCEAYPDTGTVWRTACAGQYVGRKEAVLDLWHEFLSGRWEQSAGGSTQEMMHRMYAAGRTFGIDSGCQVFQIMGHRSQPHMTVLDGKASNRITGSHPMFLHFGGRAPGMGYWMEKLYG